MNDTLGQALRVGPLTIPLWLPAALFAFAGAAAAMAFSSGSDRALRRRGLDILTNAGVVWLLVWKLSPLLFRTAQVFEQPLLLLYAPGGLEGAAVGFAAAALAAAITVYRGRRDRRALAFRLGVSALSGLLVFGGAAALGSRIFFPPAGSAGGGREAPPFSLETTAGGTVSLEQYRGKTVVLNFWATWCPPCRAEVPELNAFHRTLDEGSAVLLAVNQTFSEPSTEAVTGFAERFSIVFPILLDRTGRVSAAYGVRGIPTTFVIGPDGTIRAHRVGVVSRSWLQAQLDG